MRHPAVLRPVTTPLLPLLLLALLAAPAPVAARGDAVPLRYAPKPGASFRLAWTVGVSGRSGAERSLVSARAVERMTVVAERPDGLHLRFEGVEILEGEFAEPFTANDVGLLRPGQRLDLLLPRDGRNAMPIGAAVSRPLEPFAILAEDPVAPGDAWEAPDALNTERLGAMRGLSRWTYDGPHPEGGARLHAVSCATRYHDDRRGSSVAEKKRYLLDPASGYIRRAKMVHDADLRVDRITMSSRMNFELEVTPWREEAGPAATGW